MHNSTNATQDRHHHISARFVPSSNVPQATNSSRAARPMAHASCNGQEGEDVCEDEVGDSGSVHSLD
eukprot:3054510-Pleurochrysis_carterae.AAC.1